MCACPPDGKPDLMSGLPPWTTGFKAFIYDSGTVGSIHFSGTPPAVILPMNKSELRKLIRRKRRSLSPQQRRQAGHGLLTSLRQNARFCAAQRVALYLSNDGEIDTRNVIEDLWRRGKQVFLPVLHPVRKGHLSFIRYDSNTVMRNNRYGIAEPDFGRSKRVNTRFLSMVCLPLVAFDQRGNRLGMGGGYYDRTLAFMTQTPCGIADAKGQQPELVGCAYAFQQVPQLPAESWDIGISAIATDNEFHPF